MLIPIAEAIGCEGSLKGSVRECAFVIDHHGHELDSGTKVLPERPGCKPVHWRRVVPVVHEHHAIKHPAATASMALSSVGIHSTCAREWIAAELVAHFIDLGKDG